MKLDRRQFLCAASMGAMATAIPAFASSSESTPSGDSMGMLVDTTECIGCRKCEWACSQANGLTDLPLEAYEDTSVFATPRRMEANAFTVVNQYANPSGSGKPTSVKSQCMHCLRPACVSACIVGALQRKPNGAVTYDAWKCIGCRYCMVACPFQVPAYEYDDALTPRVRKCTFCFERVQRDGTIPACAAICPPMCLTYAKRSELLTLAREKIAASPDKYHDHIYGEHEVGGTSWLYLTSRPAAEFGLLDLDDKPVPELTESIQHSVFKFGIPPLLLFGLLGAAMNTFAKEEPAEDPES